MIGSSPLAVGTPAGSTQMKMEEGHVRRVELARFEKNKKEKMREEASFTPVHRIVDIIVVHSERPANLAVGGRKEERRVN